MVWGSSPDHWPVSQKPVNLAGETDNGYMTVSVADMLGDRTCHAAPC